MHEPQLKRFGIILFFLCGLVCAWSSTVRAGDGDNVALMFRGVARTLFSSVEIPRTIMQNPGGAPFPFNVVTGTVAGTFKTVAGTVMGAGDMVRGAAPYAKYLIFL